MDPNDGSLHRRSHTNPQFIPLQDLGRPLDDHDPTNTTGLHRRTLSDRGRRLLFSEGSRRSSPRVSGRYAPLQDNASRGIPSIRRVDTSGNNRPVDDSGESEDEEFSPIGDRAAFQQALGFTGLSFVGERDYSSPLGASQLPASRQGLANIVGHHPSSSSLALDEDDFEDTPLGDIDNDTLPLTDSANTQPVAGASFGNNLAIPHSSPKPSGRLSLQTVRFNMDEHSPRSSRLGDNLSDAERGISSPVHSRSRSASQLGSLSPTASPLHRASTIVRKMSQRVVNVSNEPELAQQELARRRSARQAEIEGRVPITEPQDPFVDGPSSPLEKPSSIAPETEKLDWVKYANPLKGKSLGIFPPNSRIRTGLCDFLVHPLTEPCILLLITLQAVLLAVDAAPDALDPAHAREKTWGHSWIDFALLALFAIYTAEIIIHVIVSGFVVNAVEYSTIQRGQGLKQAVLKKASGLFALQRRPSTKAISVENTLPLQPSILRTFTTTHEGLQHGLTDFRPDERQQARMRLAYRAFMRHSFNRLDFLAVVSYWISFVLSLTGAEDAKQLYVFRMLSCLRLLRLLNLTAGTSIILRSLKKAAPLLLNVALLIGFFWLLFAIIGVQSFKSSLRRTCVWIGPEQNVTLNQVGGYQFCGSSLSANGSVSLPWYRADGSSGGASKGYQCPQGSLCIESSNPYNGTVSFDNILQSLELVFVIISSNTYTDIMYYLTNSDYLAASLFFAGGIIVLTLWLVSLLIAVITSSFQIIREESQSSAFAAQEAHDHLSLKEEHDDEPSAKRRKVGLKYLYDKSFWLWIGVIVYDAVVQCLRSYGMGKGRQSFINETERVVTLVLLFEIIFRFAADPRHFMKRKRNWFDLFLAVATSIIQIPKIRDSGRPYAWLTVFQIMRLYRVVIALPLTRDLIILILGNVSGVVNLMVFVLLLNFLVAILASQLFRGQIPAVNPSSGQENEVTFSTIWNSFLGIYQIYSSENWTAVLYTLTSIDVQYNTSWIAAIFFILWFILGFLVVFNMFIAVIQENFDVSEDEKRVQQVKAFLQQKELGTSSHGVLTLSSMFKLRQLGGNRQDPLDYGSAMMEMLLKEAVVRDFLDDDGLPIAETDTPSEENDRKRPASSIAEALPFRPIWQRIRDFLKESEPNPFYSRLKFDQAYEGEDPRLMARKVVSAAEQRKKAQREYLKRHPTYNVSLYLFKPDNKFRRACQKLVGPGRGHERIEGAAPSPLLWYLFSAVLYAAIVAMVLLACVSTPLYQKEYFQTHGYTVRNWFVFADMVFAIIFTVEAAIRVVADGLFMTPNAYFRSSWGFIDGLVLITLWINVLTELFNQGAISRAVGAFQALRALRLLNVSDSARDTFHSVIVRGGWKILSAAFVSLSLLVPFAIYGLNLFNGKLYSCNDGGSNIELLNNCVNEYSATPYQWDVVSPRVASNPYYDFDDFGSSLFILFQIISLEGWIDVMYAVSAITGTFTQPSPLNEPGNAVFFVAFHLLGSVFVLTLFVSVFMRNYTEQTGVAFLTAEQRSWLELRKLLRQISPSKRPSESARRSWQQWCYRRVIRKTGRWQRFVTGVLVFHLILLCCEWYPEPAWWEVVRAIIFFILTLFYIANVVIRIVGLTWPRFRKSAWDVYSLFAVTGTFIVSILLVTNVQSRIYAILHKLFLVSIVLLLIPRNNQLDQLFKTAAASLGQIANLMATWFVLFLVYAIAFTQTFGLTRFASNENGNVNFRDVPKALILLFRMSTGEGWNQIMNDYASVSPPFCTVGDSFMDGDCGSSSWANALFISWNVLSMYIFVNMFISLIFESFSYVYQRSSGLASVSRKEIRRFKQAWSEFDRAGTGYIPKEKFPKLLGELSGVFEMRIYPEEFTVGSLVNDCKKDTGRTSGLPIDDHRTPYEIDIKKLNARLNQMPVAEIRRRRAEVRQFYEEVMVSADPDRGIGFTTLLMILAHYKVISDSKSLRLEEFLRRRARLQRVDEAVRRGIVINFFDTLYRTRKFRKFRESRNITNFTQMQVPEILVEGDALSPIDNVSTPFSRPALSLQIPMVNIQEPDDETDSRGDLHRSNSIQVSPLSVHSRQNSISPPESPGRDRLSSFDAERRASSQSRRVSDISDTPSPFESARERSRQTIAGPSSSYSRSRGGSNVSAQDVLDVFDNSAWGESMRRSMTLKRGSNEKGKAGSSKSPKSPRSSH